MSQSNPTNYPSNQPSFPNFPKQDDEIDLRELFLALWKDKIIIVIATMLLSIAAALYAYKQPNVYQSSATLIINPDPYGLVQGRGVSPGSQIGHQAAQALPTLKSQQIKSYMFEHYQDGLSDLSGLSISKARNGDISVSKSASSPSDAYTSVSYYVTNVNDAFKALQLITVEVSLSATKNILDQQSGVVKEVLTKKYAELLFQKAILESPETQLISITVPPVKPTTHIKPKRALTVVLGTLLGAIFGIAIVLIRFAFRREEQDTK